MYVHSVYAGRHVLLEYCIPPLKEEAYPVDTSIQKTLMGIQSETEVEIDVRKIVLI